MSDIEYNDLLNHLNKIDFKHSENKEKRKAEKMRLISKLGVKLEESQEEIKNKNKSNSNIYEPYEEIFCQIKTIKEITSNSNSKSSNANADKAEKAPSSSNNESDIHQDICQNESSGQGENENNWSPQDQDTKNFLQNNYSNRKTPNKYNSSSPEIQNLMQVNQNQKIQFNQNNQVPQYQVQGQQTQGNYSIVSGNNISKINPQQVPQQIINKDGVLYSIPNNYSNNYNNMNLNNMENNIHQMNNGNNPNILYQQQGIGYNQNPQMNHLQNKDIKMKGSMNNLTNMNNIYIQPNYILPNQSINSGMMNSAPQQYYSLSSSNLIPLQRGMSNNNNINNNNCQINDKVNEPTNNNNINKEQEQMMQNQSTVPNNSNININNINKNTYNTSQIGNINRLNSYNSSSQIPQQMNNQYAIPGYVYSNNLNNINSIPVNYYNSGNYYQSYPQLNLTNIPLNNNMIYPQNCYGGINQNVPINYNNLNNINNINNMSSFNNNLNNGPYLININENMNIPMTSHSSYNIPNKNLIFMNENISISTAKDNTEEGKSIKNNNMLNVSKYQTVSKSNNTIKSKNTVNSVESVDSRDSYSNGFTQNNFKSSAKKYQKNNNNNKNVEIDLEQEAYNDHSASIKAKKNLTTGYTNTKYEKYDETDCFNSSNLNNFTRTKNKKNSNTKMLLNSNNNNSKRFANSTNDVMTNKSKQDDLLNESSFKTKKDYNALVDFFGCFQEQDEVIKYICTPKGCRHIQSFLVKATTEMLSLIIDKIKEKISVIMQNPYANYFFQKLSQCLNHEQRYIIIDNIKESFLSIASDNSGTHALQALFEVINTDLEVELINETISKNFISICKVSRKPK